MISPTVRAIISLLRFCTLLIALLCGSIGKAQTQSPGKILSFQKIAAGFKGSTATGIFEVQAYSDQTIRDRISKNKSFDEFDYALAPNAPKPMASVATAARANELEITTRSLTVIIERSPSFRIIFKNKQGAILNEDEAGAGFGTHFTGEKVTAYKKLMEGERFVGLGEALGNLDKRGMGITLNNTDNYKYGDPRIPMYISVPFYIGIHHQLVYGLYFNNSYKGFFNFGASNIRFASAAFDGGDMDYFFFGGDSMASILEQYTAVTGRMPLPPKWSMGYHQSRCSYYPQGEVMTLARTFREKNIPIDCIVLDADYLHEYEPFRIDKKRFPDMRGMADSLAAMHIELTASVNPGIKIDSSYDAYLDGLREDVFLRYTDGNLYTAAIDPNLNHYPDFTSARGRSWWSQHMRFLEGNGIHGYWNDMNEPAVSGQAMPDNIIFDFDGRKANTLRAKNIYGMQMARASFEAAQQFGGDKRPFVLSRSAFAGVQRYAAVWSGDNQAKDEFLLMGCLLTSQMGLSGIPFTGPDLGGYIGDGNKELYRRWVEVGVFAPFVRNHREAYANAGEPWAYGEEAEAVSKNFIEFRYRLFPYVYSTFRESTVTGMPVARSLCIDYPFDPRVYEVSNQYQFMFGDALLVVPATSLEKRKSVYLPSGDWYDLYHDMPVAGGKTVEQEISPYEIPLYVKASSIIPMQTPVQSSRESAGDTLYLHVYNGKEKNEFSWYEDDGQTLQYQRGAYCERKIIFDPQQKTIRLSAQKGDYQPGFKIIKLILHGFSRNGNKIKIDGQAASTTEINEPLLDVLGHMEKIYDIGALRVARGKEPANPQQTVVTNYRAAEMVISW